MNEDFASLTGFEVAVGDPLASARASADMATIGAGISRSTSAEDHSAPVGLPSGRDSGMALA